MNSSAKVDKLTARIEKACAGLVYMSETDAAVVAVNLGSIERLTEQNMLSALKKRNDEPIEQTQAANFFERLTRERDWHTAVEKKKAKQFAKLRQLLEKELDDLKVFRIGRIKIDIYVVGKTDDCIVSGIKTSAVET